MSMLTPTGQRNTTTSDALRFDIIIQWKLHAPALPASFKTQLGKTPGDHAILRLRISIDAAEPTAASAFVTSTEDDGPRIALDIPKNALQSARTLGLLPTDATRYIHLDAPHVLTCTLEANPAHSAEARLLYAHTPLLRQLKLPGGRYEALGASLHIH